MIESVRRRFVPLAAALAVLLSLTAVLIARGLTPAAGHPGIDHGAQQLGDPDYGVCRGADPRCYHDWGNFDPATKGYKVLLFTRTAGPRHANLGPALAARRTASPSTGPRTWRRSPPRTSCSGTTR
jgi:hypothetical protein